MEQQRKKMTLKKKETFSEAEKVQFKLAPTVVTPVVPTSSSVPVLPKKISFLDEESEPIKTEQSEKTEDEINEKKRRNSENIELHPVKKIRTNELKRTALEELTSTIKKKQSFREELDQKKKLEKLQQEKEKERQQALESKQPTDNWLVPGLIVKVMNKKVGDGSYYGKKGKIIDVIDLYVGIIQILDSNVKLKVDQAHLESVIPAIGSDVYIVNGEQRGKVGILEEVNVNLYKAVVRVDDVIIQKDYEEVCKISDV